MDDYELDVARQPRGPFNKVTERQLIRRVAEHWVGRQRYSAEQRRRIKSYGWWLGAGAPIVLTIYKFVEAYLAKGG